MPGVEKTSVFGTAVHAVLQDAARRIATARSPTLAAAGIAVTAIEAVAAVARGRVLDVVEQASGMREALAVGRQRVAADPRAIAGR